MDAADEQAAGSRKERNRLAAKNSRQNARRADPAAFKLKRARCERNRPGYKAKRARQDAAAAATQLGAGDTASGVASGAMGWRPNGLAGGAANGASMPAQVATAPIDPLPVSYTHLTLPTKRIV